MRLKTLKIRPETHRRLQLYGHKGETFDEIINRLLDEVEEKKKHATNTED